MKRNTMTRPHFFTELSGDITARSELGGWTLERDGVYMTSVRIMKKDTNSISVTGNAAPKVFAKLGTAADACFDHDVHSFYVEASDDQ